MASFRSTDSNYYRPSWFGGFQYFPPVIKALLISNVAVFLGTKFLENVVIGSTPLRQLIEGSFALYPLGSGFQIWQLVTYMFMHGGFMHLFFNMLWLWMFGMELEHIWGSKKFLMFYLICGLGAGISNLIFNYIVGQTVPTVGASGAIMGILLAFGMMFPNRPVFVSFLFPVPAKYFVTFVIGMDLLSGVAGSGDGIAHFAHLGGAAVGFIYLMIDQHRNPFGNLWTRTLGRLTPADRVNRFSYEKKNVTDAKYHDVMEHGGSADQQQIDEILDKISQSGYQSLSEDEKKLLFDASKRLN